MLTTDTPPANGKGTTLFLAGDVMTGRGIDQVLPHPCPPEIFEPWARSAADYVALAERANGPIPRRVGFDYVWGDALDELARRRPAARIVNLETAVTEGGEAQPKGINYRMHPDNVAVLAAAGIDCCTLANNHVLDWGLGGLSDTLAALRQAGIATAGAGDDAETAERPAVLEVRTGRILVFAFGTPDSGISPRWSATADRAGVGLLPRLDSAAVAHIASRVGRLRRPRDLVVTSIHWGGNWGDEIPAAQREFARALIGEGAADVVFGHSSHHPKAIEVIDGKLVLYGCGDFFNDYEGIGGHESFRGDLVLMYLPTVRPDDGALISLAMMPFRIRRFRLERASPSDARWLAQRLDRVCAPFGTRVALGGDGALVLQTADIADAPP